MSGQEFQVMPASTPGGTRIRGRSLVATISNGASAAFAVTNFLLIPSTFQRLASMASIYEEYFFHSADIMFQPNSGTMRDGAVSCWVDYDSGDVPEVTQVEAARNISYSINNVYAIQGCKMLGSLCRLKRYVTATSVSNNLQAVQCVIRVGTEGIPAPFSSSVGYLFIKYDVEFFVPN